MLLTVSAAVRGLLSPWLLMLRFARVLGTFGRKFSSLVWKMNEILRSFSCGIDQWRDLMSRLFLLRGVQK